MSEYDVKKTDAALPKRPLPAPPKPKAAPLPAKAVPTAEDLLDPAGPVDMSRSSPASKLKGIDKQVGHLYQLLGQAKDRALGALAEPPPPPDHAFALELISGLSSALASNAMGFFGHWMIDELKSAHLSEPVFGMIKDKLHPFEAAAGSIGKALATPSPRGGAGAVHGAASPSAKTLLEEFAARITDQLIAKQSHAEGMLVAAGDLVGQQDAAQLDALISTLDAFLSSDVIGAWFEAQIAMGWMNFTATLSIGRRDANETTMPGANSLGGSKDIAWRAQHDGFVEINVDFPDEVNGLQGVVLGSISVKSNGPGTARILQSSVDPAPAVPARDNSPAGQAAAGFDAAFSSTYKPPTPGMSLATLPVFRRLWLGQTISDRMPDIVITPDQRLEVNENSSLLAAVGSGESGGFRELFGRGRFEERERQGLEEKTLGPKPTAAHPDAGPLANANLKLEGPPTTRAESQRLIELTAKSVTRSHDAQAGARKILELLTRATTGDIKG